MEGTSANGPTDTKDAEQKENVAYESETEQLCVGALYLACALRYDNLR